MTRSLNTRTRTAVFQPNCHVPERFKTVNTEWMTNGLSLVGRTQKVR